MSNNRKTAETSKEPILIDAHTHVHFHAYQDDADTVIRRALDMDIWMITVGTQQSTSQSAVETALRYPEGVYATVGLHPIHTEESYHDAKELGAPDESSAKKEGQEGFMSRGETFDYAVYKALALHPKVVGIGECGLDYYRLSEETKKKQYDTFASHIELARDVKKPLMIHCRNAFTDLISVIEDQKRLLNNPPGVIHFFTGTKENAKKLLGLGFSFTFGGVLTFTHDYDDVVRYIPQDRILLETDAPYVAPIPYRGKRNEPAYILATAKKLAEIKGLSEEDTTEQIVKNTRAVFCI
ncbi:MAG: TatD family hydrolase [Candidatus Sungbacteria bacterium]|nr:TatD family hydrolase [Candidatus Sungbacteria bacterium]